MEQCRVCLKQSTTARLLNQLQKEKFLHITGIELNESSSNLLCNKCMKTLDSAWRFRLQALNAENILRNQEGEVNLICDITPKIEFKCEPELEIDPMLLKTEEIIDFPPITDENEQENPFICDLCNERFNTYRKILVHIRMHRKELGRYCRFCDKVFENRSQMSHHERHHVIRSNKPSSYVCENCGKYYSDMRKLRMHSRTHAESYKCTIEGCSDAFTQKRAFYSHFATKHGIKQPCVCTDCGNTFSNHLTLRNHRRLFHNEGDKVFCAECPMKFLNQGQLDNHIAVKHRGERKHQCHICPKSYGRSTHLKRHYRDSHYDTYLELLKTKKKWKF